MLFSSFIGVVNIIGDVDAVDHAVDAVYKYFRCCLLLAVNRFVDSIFFSNHRSHFIRGSLPRRTVDLLFPFFTALYHWLAFHYYFFQTSFKACH